MAPPNDSEHEVEWQFDVPDLRPVLRWIEAAGGSADGVELSAARTVNQRDTYLDTDDRRLDGAGYSVRIRRSRRHAPEATLKSVGSNGAPADGLRIRRELEEQLEGDEPAALARATGPVGERVRALAGPRTLAPLFDVQTRRRIFPLATEGASAGELSVDDTAIRGPDGRIVSRLRRVEVEVPAEARTLVEPLVERLRSTCGLQPAALSKYEFGLLATGAERVAPPAFGRTEIGPDDAIGTVALAVLRRQLSTMLAKEAGARLGDDIEELHDLRVATRRMRAALALFAEVLPAGAADLRTELAWVAEKTGAVRDLDVQLRQLDGWMKIVAEQDRQPLARLRSLLGDERTAARAEMLQALDSPRYERFVRRFGRLLRTRSGTRTPSALAVAPELVERRHRALRKAARQIGRRAEPAAHHQLRIAAKRFRYTLEFLAEVYPGVTPELVRRTVALQDLLGEYQDAAVAIERLRRLAEERGVELGSTTVFAMGEVAERYRQGMADVPRRAPALCARLEGKAWRRLRRRLESARPVPAPPVAA